MDRTFLAAAVVFAALAAAGAAMTAVGTETEVLRSLGPALLGGGLAAFLVEAFEWDRRRTRN